MHIGIPRSARVVRKFRVFDCMGSGIPSSEQAVSGIPNSDVLLIPGYNPLISGIPNLDLRIPGSYQKSGIPASIPEIVQHWEWVF